MSFILLAAVGLSQLVSKRKSEDDDRRVVRDTELKLTQIAALQNKVDRKKEPFDAQKEYTRLREKLKDWSDEEFENKRIPRP